MGAFFRPEEAEAQRVFEQVTGVRLRLHDDGSRPGMVDFVFDGSAPDGAVEVTSFTDPKGRQASAEWGKSQESVFVYASLANSWLLSVHERTRFKGLAARCAPALVQLEAAGLTNMTAEMCSTFPPGSVADSMKLLVHNGVSDAEVIDTKPPTGQVHISPTGSAWAADADAALQDLEAHLASAETTDVRAKLAATGFSERHAFLWVDYFNRFGAAWPIAHGDLPSRPPQLPAEITGVWLALRQGDGWWWSSASGWQRFRFTPTT